MRNVNKNTLLLVPLWGKRRLADKKEGLKLIKNLPLLPRLTAVLPPQGRESNGCFTSSQNVGRVLPNSKGCSPSPLVGEGARRAGEGFLSGFTLIELLVVVLIIGILAAVALPQYQRAVEKARMTEAIINVRAIANAHQLYYLAHGEYADETSLNKLDVTIPGIENTQISDGRVQTQNFVYSPNNSQKTNLALAQHLGKDGNINTTYYIAIRQDSPMKVVCNTMAAASSIQKKLCAELNSKGTL